MYVSRETLKSDLVYGLKYFNVDFNEEKIYKFLKYLDEIILWSKIKNITSIKDEKEIILKHFIDSISSAIVIKYKDQQIIDLGTGAGLPGLPLKIIFPDIKITFIDSEKKKTDILEKICNNLEIKNYEIINDNIENLGRKINYRNQYDIAICRALSNFSTVLEYGIPFLKKNGRLIMYKGPNFIKEVDNFERPLSILQSKISKNVCICLPLSDIKRRIIVVEKIGITSDKYPRRVGVPKKRPL